MMKPALTTTLCQLKHVLGSSCLISPQLWVVPHLCQAYIDVVDDTTQLHTHFLTSAKLCALYDTFKKLKSPFVNHLASTAPIENVYAFITYVVLDALAEDTLVPYTLEIRHLSASDRRACIVAYFIYSYSYAQEFRKPFTYILNEYDPADTTITLTHRDAFRLDQLPYPIPGGTVDATPLLSVSTLTPIPMGMALTVPLALAQYIDAVASDTLAYLSDLCTLPVSSTHLTAVTSVGTNTGVDSAAHVPVPQLRRDWPLPYAYSSTLGIVTTETQNDNKLAAVASRAGAASGAVSLSSRWTVDAAAGTASGCFPYHVLFRNGVLYVESPVLEAIASHYLARTQSSTDANGVVDAGTIQPAAVCRRWLRDGLTHHVTMGHMYAVQSQAAMDALHQWLATHPLQLRVEGLGSVCDDNTTATHSGLQENRAHYVVLSCIAYGQHYRDIVGTRICLHMTVAFTENDIHNQIKDETTIIMK